MNDPIDIAIVGAGPYGLSLGAHLRAAGPTTGAWAALKSAHRRERLVEPTLVVGAGATAVRVVEPLGNHPELGSTPRGFRDSRRAEQRTPLPLLGEPAELANVVAGRSSRRTPARRTVDAWPKPAEHVSMSAAGAAA